ncbi:MAG: hypothetical protein NUV82_00735, partial [Candidatus Komeilibacteria bacterium]|nr:hypothetical protein [Candidatus Komeilibacteria bacterium]
SSPSLMLDRVIDIKYTAVLFVILFTKKSEVGMPLEPLRPLGQKRNKKYYTSEPLSKTEKSILLFVGKIALGIGLLLAMAIAGYKFIS